MTRSPQNLKQLHRHGRFFVEVQNCRACGRTYQQHGGTFFCVCWKMRLPKRKEK